MKQVIVAIPEALLLLGGTGPIADELQTRIQESGLERNVQRLGRVSEDDLPTAYRAADITVVPSQALEGFGLITLESLASGTPVLVTPIGGLPEIVSALAPQCVFADTSAESMTELIKDVLSGRQALPNDEECRAYAVENFAWSWIAEQVVKVYQEAIS